MTVTLLPVTCWCERQTKPMTPLEVHAGTGWACRDECQPGCAPFVYRTPKAVER